MNTATSVPVACQQILPTRSINSLSEDVESGLLLEPRTMPPKYFYDERGSLLFDQICDAPEYYPTRTEAALLREIASEVIAAEKPECIVELGSGTSRKTRYLLDACTEQAWYPVYSPVDVCDEILVSSSESLQADYEWLDVRPLVGDYTAGLGNLPRHKGRNLVVFLGGTIGNFAESDARDFLAELRATMSPGDSLLIGADRVKQPDVLHAAYNDDAGITAAFNLNLLHVLNRELGADFDVESFEHYAHFNPLESRIEMQLISRCGQQVRLNALDQVSECQEGDHILTEISRKFTRAQLERLLREAGFTIANHYESAGTKFSLVLAHPV